MLENRIVRTASELGGILDCDLTTGQKIGGGAATDNTLVINTYLAEATAQNPRTLIIDGGCLIAGIVLPTTGYCSIVGEGWLTGFFMKAGACANAIQNGNPPEGDPGPPAPPRNGGHVTLENFLINGNRGSGGPTNNSTSGNPKGCGASGFPWLFGLDFANISHIRIRNLYFYDIPTYNIRLGNCFDVVVDSCYFSNPSRQYNTDGVHINGGCSDIFISNCWFQTGDDAIAINAPEGYGVDIDRVAITNCIFHDVFTMVRIFATRPTIQTRVRNIVISNCVGRLITNAAFYIAGEGATNPVLDAIQDVSISNVTATGGMNGFILLSENVGSLKVNQCTWFPTITNTAFIYFYNPAAYVISACDINQCSIYLTGPLNNYLLLGTAVSTYRIKSLRINGFARDGMIPYPPMIQAFHFAGSIDRLTINAMDSANIASFGLIAGAYMVNGPGLMGTGWLTADVKIPNNTLYLAADHDNEVAVRVNGVVNVLTDSSSGGGGGDGQQAKDSWPMNETVGTTFLNTSNPTNYMTVSGITWTTHAGFPGRIVPLFNGSAIANAVSGTSTAFNGSTPFSISVWLTATTLSAGSGNQTIAGNLDTANSNRGWYLLLYNQSVRFYLVSDLSATDYLYVSSPEGGPGSPLANFVYMITVTYDGSKSASGIKIYINQNLAVSTVMQNSLSGVTTSNVPVFVGALPGGTQGFTGIMQSMGIWNRELSAGEIAAMFGL